MKVTAQDLAALKVIERIVPEPVGGAHRDPEGAARSLGDALVEELDRMSKLTPAQIIAQREERFLGIGVD
jgi:acetyl-CoA carboxylase carboxyl transferase subunit alpha